MSGLNPSLDSPRLLSSYSVIIGSGFRVAEIEQPPERRLFADECWSGLLAQAAAPPYVGSGASI
jgi:hypothetical protein